MEIIVGKMAGFCTGVKNAVENTINILEENKEVAVLGELVHNEEVIKNLEQKGLRTIEDINNVVEKSSLIIRAHGVPKQIYKEAEMLELELIDLTCPKVLAIHKKAETLVEENKYIILVGKKSHPETIGTISFCGQNSCIVEDEEDIDYAIDKIKKSNIKNVALISQTTYSIKKFEKISNELENYLSNLNIKLEIYNTICNATYLRQKETDQLSKMVDYMIIIGGKNSSNTQKLYEVASQNNKNVVLVQNKEQINVDEIIKYNKIGIMAGASTPKSSIDEIVDLLNKKELIKM